MCNAFHNTLWKTLPFVGRFFPLFLRGLAAAAQVAFFAFHHHIKFHAAFAAFSGPRSEVDAGLLTLTDVVLLIHIGQPPDLQIDPNMIDGDVKAIPSLLVCAGVYKGPVLPGNCEAYCCCDTGDGR